MYESPIEIFTTELHTAYEDGIMKAVQNVGFNVNKEELIKALQYDRDQYRKGYEDGRPPKGEWIEDPFGSAPLFCSICGHKESMKALFMYSYCPNCGADMRGDMKGVKQC